MIVRATLTLGLRDDLVVEPGAGRLTHALALDIVRRGDPGVSAWLHPPTRPRGRPAEIGKEGSPPRRATLLVTSGVVTGRADGYPDLTRAVPVSAGREVHVRVTALGGAVCAALLAGLQQTREARLASVRCDVKELRLERVELDDLWRAAKDDAGAPIVHFMTPTVFERRGVYVALPLPERVFGSEEDIGGLVRRWLDCAAVSGRGHARVAEGLAGWGSVHVGVAPLGLEEARTDMGTWGAVGGFVGRCRFECAADHPRHRRGLWALCRFAEYAGVGLKTGMGFGQVRLSPPPGSADGAAGAI